MKPLSRKVVIVVDDEPLLRLVALEAFIEEGFEVFEATNADEALRILSNGATNIGALFTDIHMPGSMDGLALAHFTRHRWPWIALLIASGRGQPSAREMPAESRFLNKPYSPYDAVNKLKDMICRAGG
jgi:CheY-like chemotaxis protein